jgi:hypothetical protein
MPDEDLNRRFEEWKRSLDRAVEKHLKQFKKTADDALKIAADARDRVVTLEKKIAELMRRPK